MSASIRELKAKIADAEELTPRRRDLRLKGLCAEPWLETVNALETSLREEVVRLRFDNTRLDDQRKLAVPCGSRARDLLDRVSEDNRTLRKNVCN